MNDASASVCNLQSSQYGMLIESYRERKRDRGSLCVIVNIHRKDARTHVQLSHGVVKLKLLFNVLELECSI